MKVVKVKKYCVFILMIGFLANVMISCQPDEAMTQPPIIPSDVPDDSSDSSDEPDPSDPSDTPSGKDDGSSDTPTPTPPAPAPTAWKLVWEENFNKTGVIDNSVWTKIPRGVSDWDRHMSSYDGLYDVKDGNVVLKGMANPGLKTDNTAYLTGGIHTKGKKSFSNGKIEIRAKLESAQGAWPAIWLMPFDNVRWPYGGEIDIMEHINYDAKVYQTVHSNYTYYLNQKTNPRHYTTVPINKDDYNVYGVELYADSVVFSVNNKRTLNYPRMFKKDQDKDGQFPFDRAYYLLIDMQLDGAWAGKVNPKDLPVAMFVDWVRFYERK